MIYFSTGYEDRCDDMGFDRLSCNSQHYCTLLCVFIFSTNYEEHCDNMGFVCLFVLLLYVPSQQLWSLRDGQFT